MMKFLFLLFGALVFAQDAEVSDSQNAPDSQNVSDSQNAQVVINCNAIFEERKMELISELRKIEEEKQNVISYHTQAQDALERKRHEIELREAHISALLEETKTKEEEIRALIAQNEELLASIQSAKANKISETYSKMQDSKAGAIMDVMPLGEAAELLNSLDSKDISKILAKMDPARAAKLTEILRKGPPFEMYDE